MPKISKITKEETEQHIELVRESVPLYDQNFSDYSHMPVISNIGKGTSNKIGTMSSISSPLKQASNNGFE